MHTIDAYAGTCFPIVVGAGSIFEHPARRAVRARSRSPRSCWAKQRRTFEDHVHIPMLNITAGYRF